MDTTTIAKTEKGIKGRCERGIALYAAGAVSRHGGPVRRAGDAAGLHGLPGAPDDGRDVRLPGPSGAGPDLQAHRWRDHLGRSEEKRGTVIALRKTSTDDATNATTAENVTGKPDTGGDTASSNATANATRNPADRAEGGISGNSGIRNGNFSGPAPFDAEAGEDVAVAELKARRARPSPEEERRVRELVRKGFSEGSARAEVLAKDHPLDCECEVCL